MFRKIARKPRWCNWCWKFRRREQLNAILQQAGNKSIRGRICIRACVVVLRSNSFDSANYPDPSGEHLYMHLQPLWAYSFLHGAFYQKNQSSRNVWRSFLSLHRATAFLTHRWDIDIRRLGTHTNSVVPFLSKYQILSRAKFLRSNFSFPPYMDFTDFDQFHQWRTCM